jgi:hypothetical protein
MSMHITPDKTVPYPESLEPEVASTLRENMQIASNTAEVLKALGAEVDDDPEAQDKAGEVFKAFAERAKQQFEDLTPQKRGPGRPRKETSASPPTLYELPVADRITNMLREYNNEFVADAAQLRQVVTNKLLDLASCGDPKIEIKATEMLGKISDVGLFSEKTEISVTYNNSADLDQAIKDNVRKLMRLYGGRETAIDVDLDKEFGPTLELEMAEEVDPDEPADRPRVVRRARGRDLGTRGCGLQRRRRLQHGLRRVLVPARLCRRRLRPAAVPLGGRDRAVQRPRALPLAARARRGRLLRRRAARRA